MNFSASSRFLSSIFDIYNWLLKSRQFQIQLGNKDRSRLLRVLCFIWL